MCVCVLKHQRKAALTPKQRGRLFPLSASANLCVFPAKCECVGYQRAAVKTPERRGSARPRSGAATHEIMCPERERWRENIMPFPFAHNPGNPGSERYPIPTSASSSDSHKALYIPSNGMSSSLLLHMPTLRPSRLLTQTGAPQRPKAAFASSDPPQISLCLCGVHLNQWGHGSERPLLSIPSPSRHHLSLA